MKFKFNKKSLYAVFGALALLVIVLVIVMMPSKKEKTTETTTIVAQDVRIKSDIVYDGKVGGADGFQTFTLSVDKDEAVLDYIISKPFKVTKSFDVVCPKQGDMMPYSPSLQITNRYYVMIMVGDILKREVVDHEGNILEEEYTIENARSEYRIIPVALLTEYNSFHLEHQSKKDVKIMSRNEFMTKVKDVNQVDSLVKW